MVVLEDVSMLTTGHNQYLQPDYLSPVPPTQLDAKKSPLALLAQTCSQIGADSPSKPLLSSMDKPSKGSSSAANARSPPAAKLERTRSSPSDGKSSSSSNSGLAFKPYETNVVSMRRSSGDEASSRPGSKASSVHSASGLDSANNSASDETNNNNNISNNNSSKKSASRSTPQGRKTASPSHPSATSNAGSPHSAERKTPADSRDKYSASPRNNNSGASPIIRSGMEILSGHPNHKDSASLYKSGLGGYPGNPLCCPPGIDPAAFRPPFGGASAFSHHHAAAAAALLGYPGSTSASTPTSSPYLSYARVKTSTGAETLVPVCKDPYCTGCQYSMHNTQMMMAAAAGAQSGACPSGCTQCDHQKYSLMGLAGLGPMPPPSLSSYSAAAAAAAAASASANGRPNVCSWMAGDSFCGKRFATGDELLQHLRSHTSAGAPTDPSSTAAMLAGQHTHPLLTSTAALHRAAAAANASYPAPSLSPLSARFHPYGKPPTGPPLPASLAASPYSAFNPLGAYYSPYALYGQRMGAAVHP